MDRQNIVFPFLGILILLSSSIVTARNITILHREPLKNCNLLILTITKVDS